MPTVFETVVCLAHLTFHMAECDSIELLRKHAPLLSRQFREPTLAHSIYFSYLFIKSFPYIYTLKSMAWWYSPLARLRLSQQSIRDLQLTMDSANPLFSVPLTLKRLGILVGLIGIEPIRIAMSQRCLPIWLKTLYTIYK